jgi:hypothetical protein
VQIPSSVELVIERITASIELKRQQPELLTQLDVERGRRFYPSSIEQNFSVSVPVEDVCSFLRSSNRFGRGHNEIHPGPRKTTERLAQSPHSPRSPARV